MAYTILLVDDESAVREGIRAKTPWQDYGFTVVGEAGNGIEALELVEEFKPDVIITDIKRLFLQVSDFMLVSSHPRPIQGD
ncbi:MAG: response regulator [Sphaerochaeta sp.]